MIDRIGRVLAQELGNVPRRHRIGRVATAVMPHDSFMRTRAAVLRACGWPLGAGVVMTSTPRLSGNGSLHRKLEIGSHVYVNGGAVWELGAPIRIGDRVHIAQDVALLTTTHEVGSSACRAGARKSSPIAIGAGSWLGAGVKVFGGSSIGEGSIVAAGCVVQGDVPDNCLFGGIPGRVIRYFDDGNDPAESPERLGPRCVVA